MKLIFLYCTTCLTEYQKKCACTCISQQVVFPKGGHYALKDLSATDYDVIGIDWTVNPTEARKIVGDGITLQGNLDPCALYASKVVMKAFNLAR